MIAKALRLTREFHRMKQVDLAKRLKISSSYLSEIESGDKQPTIDLLERYADVFKVPASTFFLFKERSGGDGDAKMQERAERLLNFFEWVISEESDGSEEAEAQTPGEAEEAVSA